MSGNGNGDFPVFTPEIVNEIHGNDPDQSSVGGMLAAGNTIQQIRTSYMTAVSVQKKRDLAEITKKCEQEAQYAGDSLWYGWKQGGKEISGETIGLAMIVARNWGNCATEAFVVEDRPTHYLISASFIDLENGSTISRPFKQNKNRKMSDKQKANPEEIARQEDITLQIAVSKAVRNAILAATPGWLHARMIEAGRNALADGLTGEKLKKAIAATIHAFQDKWGVTEEMLAEYVEKPSASWVAADMIELKGVYNALKEGREKVSVIFAPKDTADPVPTSQASTPTAQAPENESASTTNSGGELPLSDSQLSREDMINEIGKTMKDLGITAGLQRNQAAGRWTNDEATSIADLFKAPDDVIKAALGRARDELRQKQDNE
ncbi:hypothetical protein HUU59_11100 [bacterium]|nr:hypothetical protein [bacterium]